MSDRIPEGLRRRFPILERLPWGQITRYVVVSLAGYAYILIAMWLLVSALDVQPTLAYVLVYITVYSLDYVLTLRFVFRADHRWTRVFRYVMYLAASLVIGTVAFALINGAIHMYLLATIVTAGILFPIRFYVTRRWVYG